MLKFAALCLYIFQALTAPSGVDHAIWANYTAISLSNTKLTHFDTLIVLGTPTNADGTPSPEQRERVWEAVKEYRAGVAPHLIMTGGAAHNSFIEAHAMRQFAITQGVPADDVLEEPQAHDTIQNIYFSHEMMESRGWKSAEVVSSPHHLPRTSLILSHYTFAWRTHAASWPPEFTRSDIDKKFLAEATGCWMLTHAGFPHNRWLPNS